MTDLRFLLLQVRNPDDPMREAEIASFCRVLEVEPERFSTHDLLSGVPYDASLQEADVVLLGGSGHYSATSGDPWLGRVLPFLRDLCLSGQPVFASCWGFQAIARALGGEVINDLEHAELGTHALTLTDEGERDPVFAPLGKEFMAQMGHEDHVVRLPPGAVLLASSPRVTNQAYRLEGQPVYCTQFHPELNREDLLERVRIYPEYIERIAGLPPERFREMLKDSTETESLLPRFLRHVLGG